MAVLVIPATHEAAPSRISVALDDHAGRHAVLRVAMHAARTWGADVRALHVLSPALRDLVRCVRPAERTLDEEKGPREDGEQIADERALVGLTRAWLTEQLAKERGDGIRARAHVGVGDPGQEIVAEAHASRAVLIVLGRASAPEDGVMPSGPFPLGSTTRLVTWAAPCAVLVVPASPVPSTAPRPRACAGANREVAGVGAA